MASNEQQLLWWVAGMFVIFTVGIASYGIVQHLFHYTVPQYQKYIVRILFMVPIYAIDSWFSLRFVEMAVFVDLARHCYEAFVLYSFFMLLVNYLDGEERIIEIFESKAAIPHPWPFHYFTFQPSRKFYYQCKTCILQFVLIQPIIALLTFFLSFTGHYKEGVFSPTAGYLWLTLLINVSISVSLYYLVLFWFAVDEELEPYNPVGKFLCIKAVIFFSFWQGVLFAILVATGAIPDYEHLTSDSISIVIQDFIICLEMYFLSIGFLYSFHWGPYETPDAPEMRAMSRVRLIRSTSDVLNIKDTIDDTKESFHPEKLSENFGIVGAVRDTGDRVSSSIKRWSSHFLNSPESMPPVEEIEETIQEEESNRRGVAAEKSEEE